MSILDSGADINTTSLSGESISEVAKSNSNPLVKQNLESYISFHKKN